MSSWEATEVARCERPFLTLRPVFTFATPDGEPLLYAQQKVLTVKDEFRVFRDASMQEERLRIRQRNVVEIGGLFDVLDPATDATVGTLENIAGGFLWRILDAEGRVVGAIARNTSMWRVLLQPKFMPRTDVIRAGTNDGPQVGTFEQHFSLFGFRATLSLPSTPSPPFDRRLAFAGALLVMAIDFVKRD